MKVVNLIIINYLIVFTIGFTCNNGCTTCSQDSTTNDFYCDTCNVGYAALEDKTSNCLPNNQPYTGYWYDNANNIFKKCDIACLTCTDSTRTTCSECNTAQGYYIV